MEQLIIKLNEVDLFDKSVHGGLPEGGDITLVTKDDGTEGHRAVVCIIWTTRLPDGTLRNVQAVTTVRNFLMAAAALRGRYGDDGIVRTFDKVN